MTDNTGGPTEMLPQHIPAWCDRCQERHSPAVGHRLVPHDHHDDVTGYPASPEDGEVCPECDLLGYRTCDC